MHFTNLEPIEMRVDNELCPFIDGLVQIKMFEQMHSILSDILVVPGINITSLKMEGVSWYNPCCDAWPREDDPNLQILLWAAPRLTHLDLTIGPCYGSADTVALAVQFNFLKYYLYYTPNLQELKLNFGKEPSRRVANIGQIFQYRWSHLRVVDISHAEVSIQHLLSFCEAHNNLEHVRLCSITLKGGTWPAAFESMSGSLMCLDSITTSGIFGDAQLIQTNSVLCGDNLNHYARQEIVNRRRVGPFAYPLDPRAFGLFVARDDLRVRQRRRAHGLPCVSCKTCGQLQHDLRD